MNGRVLDLACTALCMLLRSLAVIQYNVAGLPVQDM